MKKVTRSGKGNYILFVSYAKTVDHWVINEERGYLQTSSVVDPDDSGVSDDAEEEYSLLGSVLLGPSKFANFSIKFDNISVSKSSV